MVLGFNPCHHMVPQELLGTPLSTNKRGNFKQNSVWAPIEKRKQSEQGWQEMEAQKGQIQPRTEEGRGLWNQARGGRICVSSKSAELATSLRDLTLRSKGQAVKGDTRSWE